MYNLLQGGAFRLYALQCQNMEKTIQMHKIVVTCFARFLYHEGLAQMVKRELCMREVAGSMPASSTENYFARIWFFT